MRGMPMGDPELSAIARKAMEDAGLTEENWPSEADILGIQKPPEEGPPEPPGEEPPAPPQGPAPPAPKPEETPPVEPAPTEEPPVPGQEPTVPEKYRDNYFGFERGEMPEEDWARTVTAFMERDSLIQAEKRRNAELGKEDGKPPEQQPPKEEPASEELQLPEDDELMKLAGYDPNGDMYDLQKELVLPALKQTYTTQLLMEEQGAVAQIDAELERWETTLETLSEKHGQLPYSFEQVLEHALQNQIPTPELAYRDLFFQGREQFEEAVNATTEEVEKRKGSPPVPRLPAGSETEVKTLDDPEVTVEQAAEHAMRQHGMTREQLAEVLRSTK